MSQIFQHILDDISATLPATRRAGWRRAVRGVPDSDRLGWRFVAWLLGESGYCTSKAPEIAEMVGYATNVAEQVARGSRWMRSRRL